MGIVESKRGSESEKWKNKPVFQQNALVNVNGFLIVAAQIVDRGQAQLQCVGRQMETV